MDEVRVLFYWASGILFPTLDVAVAEALSSFGIDEANLMSMPRYHEMQENLSLGKMSDQEFCRTVMRHFDIDGNTELFRKKILDRLTLSPGVLEAISLAKSEIDRWLVVDLPEDWFKQLPFSEEVFINFPPERIIYLGNSRLLRVIPDVFYYLPNKVQVPSEHCLLLDKSIKRTVNSINHGLQSAVIINPERLKREFLLRRLTTQEYCIHQRPV